MKEINEDIKKGELKQFYLLCGVEDYLKIQYKDKLVKALVDETDQMNYHYFEGSGTSALKVMELAETLPFFSGHRVIVLENSGWMKKSPEDLEKKLEGLPGSTHLIFVEKEIDKRSKLYKWISKNGYVSEMNTPDEKMLLTWVKSMCKAEGKQMEDSSIFYLVEHMGTDMFLLRH